MKSFDDSIRDFYRDLARMSSRDPRLALHFARTGLRQREAAAKRRRAARAGVQVPPFLIVSVTKQCNLHCAGCFVREHGRLSETGAGTGRACGADAGLPAAPAAGELTTAELRTILADARDLGVSVVALAGGEPLTRPDLLDLAAEFPELLFPLITNGSLLDDAALGKLETLRNVIPVISLEGLESQTDARRGAGVHQRALEAMARLQQRGIFFGTSLMVTRRNFGLVTSRRFVRDLVDRGAKLFFYVDYVPIKSGTESLVPSETQRGLEPFTMMLLRSEFRALFLASSASESAYGGCMAAGRGFVHVSAEGDLEPCPFSPFSDTNLRRVPLRVALQSRLLRGIRESGERLSEGAGGCALWSKRDWVRSLMTPDSTAAPSSPGAAPCCCPDPLDTRRAA